jgi:hypothetical protein
MPDKKKKRDAFQIKDRVLNLRRQRSNLKVTTPVAYKDTMPFPDGVYKLAPIVSKERKTIILVTG